VPDDLVIRAVPYPCWRCKRDDVAVALLHLR